MATNSFGISPLEDAEYAPNLLPSRVRSFLCGTIRSHSDVSTLSDSGTSIEGAVLVHWEHGCGGQLLQTSTGKLDVCALQMCIQRSSNPSTNCCSISQVKHSKSIAYTDPDKVAMDARWKHLAFEPENKRQSTILRNLEKYFRAEFACMVPRPPDSKDPMNGNPDGINVLVLGHHKDSAWSPARTLNTQVVISIDKDALLHDDSLEEEEVMGSLQVENSANSDENCADSENDTDEMILANDPCLTTFDEEWELSMPGSQDVCNELGFPDC